MKAYKLNALKLDAFFEGPLPIFERDVIKRKTAAVKSAENVIDLTDDGDLPKPFNGGRKSEPLRKNSEIDGRKSELGGKKSELSGGKSATVVRKSQSGCEMVEVQRNLVMERVASVKKQSKQDEGKTSRLLVAC